MVKFKKDLGQNFLYDPSISKKIVDFSKLKDGDIVLEIGPGKGILTEELLNRNCKLFCVELDSELFKYLENKFGEKITLFNEDILEFDLEKIGGENFHVVGNLPYNISTAILKKFTIWGENISSMTFMFQFEVARRIVSKINVKDYGSLTVFSNTFWEIEKGFKLSPGSFFPAPKVYSYVLRFHSFKNLIDSQDRINYLSFLNSIFMYKRKKMGTIFRRNGYPEELFEYDDLNIDPDLRPQNISVKSYLALFQKIKKDGTF